MSYITVRGYGCDSFLEKKSEFIGYCKRVESEDEAKAFINEIKNRNKQARHNCFAYIIGEKMNILRYSDDGEPQGTAGIPILEVMKKKEIKDCVIVVTRYFGGILLGASGLTRAYIKGATIAIDNAKIIEKVLGIKITVKLDYDLFGKVQYLCNQNNWYMEDIKYEDTVEFSICTLFEEHLSIIDEMVNLCNGKIEISVSDKKDYFKEDSRLLDSL